MKKLFALLVTGTLVQYASALGDERPSSVLQRAEWQSKNFAAYMPEIPAAAPWLNLDVRNKLPKVDFPLGRPMESIGVFALQSSPDTAFFQRSAWKRRVVGAPLRESTPCYAWSRSG